MRIPMLAFVALAALSGPAMAQTRILTVPEPDQTQSIPAAPAAEPAPMAAEPHQPVTETPPPTPLVPQASAPAAAPEPAPTQEKQEKTADQLPPAPNGRFGFTRVEGGFLRLDAQSGEVAFCTAGGAGWACKTVPEDRAAFEQEIGRLQDEVAALKKELAALREPPPPRPPADLSPPAPSAGKDSADKDKGNEVTIKLPTQEDIDRAGAALHDAWRRLVDMLVGFKNDMMRKG